MVLFFFSMTDGNWPNTSAFPFSKTGFLITLHKVLITRFALERPISKNILKWYISFSFNNFSKNFRETPCLDRFLFWEVFVLNLSEYLKKPFLSFHHTYSSKVHYMYISTIYRLWQIYIQIPYCLTFCSLKSLLNQYSTFHRYGCWLFRSMDNFS